MEVYCSSQNSLTRAQNKTVHDSRSLQWNRKVARRRLLDKLLEREGLGLSKAEEKAAKLKRWTERSRRKSKAKYYGGVVETAGARR